MIPDRRHHNRTERGDPVFQMPASSKHWGVLLYGGDNPLTGFPQDPLEFEFFIGHYTRRQIEARASDMAERQHRTRFLIRDCTGAIVHRGICELWEPRFLSLHELSMGHRKYNRENRL